MLPPFIILLFLGSGSKKGLLEVFPLAMLPPGKGKCWLVACSLRGDGVVPPTRLRKGLLEPKVRVEGDGWRSGGGGDVVSASDVGGDCVVEGG